MSRSFHAVLGLCLVSTEALAQTPELVSGARVRITTPCVVEASAGMGCTPLVGTLVSRSGDKLLIREQAGSEQEVAVRNPMQLWVEQSKRRTLLGMGIGVAVGAVSGFLLAENCRSEPREDPELCNLAYVLTVPVGAGAGALVGSSMRSHQWIRVPVGDASVQVGISGRRGVSAAVGLGL